MSSRYCKACGGWHDLEKEWPAACYSHFGPTPYRRSIQIIKDIEPYKAVAVDKVTGKRPKIGSRSEHREFLKRNGYHEVGNEPVKERKVDYADIHPREIAQTIEQLRSRR